MMPGETGMISETRDEPKKPSKRWSKLIILFACSLLLLSISVAAYWLHSSLTTPYKGFPEPTKTYVIMPGMRTEEIVAALQREGVLAMRFPVLVYLEWQRRRGGIKAGEYEFAGKTTAVDVAEKLIEGKVLQHSITIPEGLSIRQLATLMQSRGLGTVEENLKLVSDPSLIRDLDPRATDLEGYLFPDTYYFVRGSQPKELVGRMVGRFREVFRDDWRRRAAELGFEIREVVTLASLIEEETAVAGERKLISAVFHRRLERGIHLQCDPTVIYASRLIGKFDGTIRQSDIKLQSPYNTYVHRGLPPGPIANPGAQSLEAALFPAEVPYLYFVAKNDGTHHFSESLVDHNRAVRAYQR